MLRLQLKNNPDRGLWLVGEKIRLGSGKDNELVLEGHGVFQYHAQILIDNQKVELENLAGSCYVNDVAILRKHELNGKDEIRIGKQELIVLDSAQVEEHKQALKSTPPIDDSISIVPNTCWTLVAEHPQLTNRDYGIQGKMTLGRGKQCDFVVPYKLLSREHALLTVDEHGLLLTDLDSSNGSYVNGKRVKQSRLNDGDTVSFAKLVFKVKALQVPDGDSQQDQANLTMLRPVVDLNRELAKQKEQQHANPQSSRGIEVPEQRDQDHKNAAQVEQSHNRWLMAGAALISVAVGVWLLFPLVR